MKLSTLPVRLTTEWHHMNRAERDTAVVTAPLPLVFGAILGLGIAYGNWLAAAAGAIAVLTAVQALVQLRVAATWRNLYQDERARAAKLANRPRPENYRQN